MIDTIDSKTLTSGRMAVEAAQVFALACDALGLPRPPGADSGEGWLSVIEGLLGFGGEATLAQLGQSAQTRFQEAAPAAVLAAAAPYRLPFQAVVIHVHGLVYAEADEHEQVIQHTSRWIDAQRGLGNAN